jgi:hypothetical protein
LAFVFDDYEENIQRNSGKKLDFLVFSWIFAVPTPLSPLFSGQRAPGGKVFSHGDALPPGLKAHQEPARRRHHADHEAGPGVGLGCANRLIVIRE